MIFKYLMEAYNFRNTKLYQNFLIQRNFTTRLKSAYVFVDNTGNILEAWLDV